MNRYMYNFHYGKYMNGLLFSLSLVIEWGGVQGLQPHVLTQNHGKLTPAPLAKRCLKHTLQRHYIELYGKQKHNSN